MLYPKTVLLKVLYRRSPKQRGIRDYSQECLPYRLLTTQYFILKIHSSFVYLFWGLNWGCFTAELLHSILLHNLLIFIIIATTIGNIVITYFQTSLWHFMCINSFNPHNNSMQVATITNLIS